MTSKILKLNPLEIETTLEREDDRANGHDDDVHMPGIISQSRPDDRAGRSNSLARAGRDI